MSRFLERLIRRAYAAVKPVIAIGNSLGLIALAGMMFLITVDVTLRKTLDMPILGSYEIVQYLMVITIGFGMAYCGLRREHINVDLVISRLPRLARGIVGCVTGFLSLAVSIIVVWQAYVYIPQLQSGHVLSPVLLIPMYPFVGIAAFGFTLYALVLLIHFGEFLSEVLGGK